MEQMVSTSLCGLPLYKAAIAIGSVHAVIFGVICIFELAYQFLEYGILISPPGIFAILTNIMVIFLVGSEALLSTMANVSLVVGACKGIPGLILTWLLQQAVWLSSSFIILFYYVASSYLKTPLRDGLFQLFLNLIQGYFFVVVYAHYQELRKGNLSQRNDQSVT